MDIAVCKLGNRTLHSSFLFVSCVSRGPFAHFDSSALSSSGGDWQFHSRWTAGALLCSLWLFFFSNWRTFLKASMGTRQYVVTNDCISKSNEMQCSLIFLTACGKAGGRKSIGFRGRVYFNYIFAALLFMRLFSGLSTLSFVLFFPFWKTGIIIIIAFKLSGT